jgi:hypothetical protein
MFLFGLALATLLAGCVGAPDPAEAPDEPPVGEAEEKLQSCNAPVNANADWIASSPGCRYATIIVDDSTGQNFINWYAGLDQVTSRYYPPFCWGSICTGGYSVRTGIAGDSYGHASVSLEGGVSITRADGVSLTITPTMCSSGPTGTTTIGGTGSDGKSYTVRIINATFC